MTRSKLFLSALAAVQIFALAKQFWLGFRPFAQAPKRVALSWDMFSTEIERCTLDWNPPLKTPMGTLKSLSDLDANIEWGVVANSARVYGVWGKWGCQWSDKPTQVKLKCFATDGQERRYGFDCP